MGAQYSSLNELKSNQYLSQFVSEEIISVNDPFWNQFLSFRLQSPFTTAHSKLIDESCSIFLQQFEANNPKTNNYGTLIEVFIRLATAVRDECDDPLLISEFTRTLLEHFIKQTECPSTLAVAPLSGSDGDSGTLYKIGQSVAYGLWSVVTLGMGSSSTSNTTDETVTADDPAYELRNRHLANQSIHLLLILSNHFTNDAHRNPYRLALLHFTDTQGNPTNLPDSEPLPWFSVDYRRLYDILCETAHTDQSTLLLYMLLHRNQHFKAYVISRTNIDQIVLPVLRVVYAATERNSHHIYMSLIILLILSEDDYFNKTIHDIKLKKLSWYTERSLNEISLGGLLVAVVLRTIQFNMTRMRDKYLHTNCLAALANMSSQFQNLHTYVSQRIVSLFNLLARKHTKTLDLIKQQTSTTDES
ncbi:unnamed protein product, partial [Rotaria magnacalcarata]